jgi:hypothetical protein
LLVVRQIELQVVVAGVSNGSSWFRFYTRSEQFENRTLGFFGVLLK